MQFILFSSNDFFIEEHQILTLLFEEGLEVLHIDKITNEPAYYERLLTLIPSEYHKRIVISNLFYLKDEYNLKGIHLHNLSEKNNKTSRGNISIETDELSQIHDLKKDYNYVLLNNAMCKYSQEEIKKALDNGIIDKKVYLEINNEENLEWATKMNISGIYIRDLLWKHFNMRNSIDFKELLHQFRVLRRIIN
ncbi:MAG: thiamine phosphate synthase [Prevotellaceae bacterium]|nr:thiamine phosphate synthase [Candidatus Faecinaster equi]